MLMVFDIGHYEELAVILYNENKKEYEHSIRHLFDHFMMCSCPETIVNRKLQQPWPDKGMAI